MIVQPLKKLISFTALSAVLASCGGGDGDNITLNTNTGDDTAVGGKGGDCSNTPGTGNEEFITYKNECSLAFIESDILEDFTLDAKRTWILNTFIKVGAGDVKINTEAEAEAIKQNGVTLTIEPGTEVQSSTEGSLLITRGSKLIADGEDENNEIKPITFVSISGLEKALEKDESGKWGGVVIQGFAPQWSQGNKRVCYSGAENGQEVCNVEGEGGSNVAFYGGNDVADNSGIIRYVRIVGGGKIAGPGNELNGLTLQGVGYGTTVEYIHVHNNLDDGVEWFGGTVNARYLVLTNNDDDDIDLDEGSKVNIQYAIVRKHPTKEAPTGSNDPRAIELNSDKGKFVTETEVNLANITIIGGAVNNAVENEQPGMRLRGAVKVKVYNSSVDNFDLACARIDEPDTDASDANLDGVDDIDTVVELFNVFGSCGEFFQSGKGMADNSATVEDDIDLSYNSDLALTNDEATSDISVNIEAVQNGSLFEFDQTDYVGAVKDGDEPWWKGWAIESALQVNNLP